MEAAVCIVAAIAAAPIAVLLDRLLDDWLVVHEARRALRQHPR